MVALWAWAERRIAGAGIDVYTDEPLPASHPFRSLDNVVATPHLVGGESGALTNLTRGGGIVEIVLPRLSLEVVFRRKGESPAIFQPPIDTVVIDTLTAVPRDRKQGATAAAASFTIELVYRAAVPAPARWSAGEIVIREARR